MIDAGQRDQLVFFERNTPTTNGHGDEIEAWTELAQAWARVRFGTGAERREAAQTRATQTATFECLAVDTSTVTMTDRISFDGAYWNINSRALVGRDQIHFTAIRADEETE